MKFRPLRAALTAAAASIAVAVSVTACAGSDSAAADPTPSTGSSSASLVPAGNGSATAVLVHGAFADSSSWTGTIRALDAAGYRTVAFADPLRGVANDAAALQSFVETIKGPVVLVGHSYAGMVISQVAAHEKNVKALVYVAAFIPEVGESAGALNAKFPGSELTPDNLNTVPAPGGLTDLYIKPDRYGHVYAGGLTPEGIKIAAATQRPITNEALAEPATAAAPASIPKWEIVATADHAVPTKAQEFMAQRAKAKVITVNTGHDVPAAAPLVVAKVIAEAAR